MAHPILFDKSGNRLATPIVRQKPDFVGPDGGDDTFLGFEIANNTTYNDTSTVAQCANNASFPNFFGTSAAAPHAAAIAALMLQDNSGLTPAQIYGALQSSALADGTTTPDFNSGYGFIQADAALAKVPAGTPPPPPPPASGGGGWRFDGPKQRCLLHQRRSFGGFHDDGTGDLVVPGLAVAIDSDPQETQADDCQR